MALCRCKEKHSNPKGKNENYIDSVQPIGYPKTSSICGRKGCKNPGLIWLTSKEYELWSKGESFFTYASSVSRVEVEKVK